MFYIEHDTRHFQTLLPGMMPVYHFHIRTPRPGRPHPPFLLLPFLKIYKRSVISTAPTLNTLATPSP